MREIVLDTETTGLKPEEGHRIVEIGALELLHRLPTGRSLQHYIDPQRDMPADAERVHGLSAAFLRGKPRFAEIAREFLDFIGDAALIIHNASFDMGFLNAELKRAGLPLLGMDRVIDTLALARRRIPGAQNYSLDALCKRFGIDLSRRDKHGALLDTQLLADVYLELAGGRQTALSLVAAPSRDAATGRRSNTVLTRPRPLAPRLSAEEAARHAEFVESLGPDALWLKCEPRNDG